VSTTPYEHARKSFEALGPADQLRLIAEFASRLNGEIKSEPHSLLDLEGLGQDVWAGVDAAEYVQRERASWNG
jgi:hypothetical protein